MSDLTDCGICAWRWNGFLLDRHFANVLREQIGRMSVMSETVPMTALEAPVEKQSYVAPTVSVLLTAGTHGAPGPANEGFGDPFDLSARN
jgi:hypothetical protein